MGRQMDRRTNGGIKDGPDRVDGGTDLWDTDEDFKPADGQFVRSQPKF